MKLALLLAGCSLLVLSAQQTPPIAPDIPDRFEMPMAGYDYVKRDVMIPMRDGVKLHTVIVVPKGATQCADAADPDAVQRQPRAPSATDRRTCVAIAAALR